MDTLTLFPKTWTKGHWLLDDLWPHICWGHMCDSTQGSLCPSPMGIYQCMWIQWSILQITTYIHILHTTYRMSDHIVSYWTQFRRDKNCMKWLLLAFSSSSYLFFILFYVFCVPLFPTDKGKHANTQQDYYGLQYGTLLHIAKHRSSSSTANLWSSRWSTQVLQQSSCARYSNRVAV